MDSINEKKRIGFLSKYDEIALQDIKSFEIKQYGINNLKEFKLIFLIYLEEIGIVIHESLKKDIKSNSLIIGKYQRYIYLNKFQEKFYTDKNTKTLEEIFNLITELIHLNKVNFILKNDKQSINLVINNKEGKQILNLNIPIKVEDNKKNNNSGLFKLSPFFRNKEIITNNCDSYWFLNKNFVIFNSYHEDELFLIYQNNDNNNIEVMKLINKQIVIYLKNIESKLSVIEHFFNDKNNFDYLLTADRNKYIKIYNISLNYQLILSFNNGETIGFISSCLLLFDENLLISSIFGKKKNDYTKIYSLNDIFKNNNIFEKSKNNINMIKKLDDSNNMVVCSILIWDYIKYKIKYLIQLSNNKIIINDIHNYNLYGYLEGIDKNKNNVFYSGNICNEIFFIAISNEGFIFYWNILSKHLIKMIEINNYNLFDSLLWSNNYLIIGSWNQKNKESMIKILDISQFMIINNIYVKEIEKISCIRKIVHQKKGNCLLISGDNNKIILLSI